MTQKPTIRFRAFASAAFAASMLFVAGRPASAITQSAYSMEILVDGVSLSEYYQRGKTYVEALEGREYSVRLTNNTGERIAVALSVDGLNSIDAKTTSAQGASKWILGPWESTTIDGWQTSGSTARRFYFTSESGSYGAWLGKTSNLGVIAAAVFREVRPQPIVKRQRSWWERWKDDDCRGCDRNEGSSRDQSSSAPAPSAEAPRMQQKAAEGQYEREADSGKKEKLSDEMAATGIGRELEHDVTRVEFRSERTAVATLQVRYEYHDELVRLGVLPQPRPWRREPLERRENAQGFSDFAPDPYRSSRR